MEKKLLVVSNEPFNCSNANGRTLMNLLKCFNKNCLAQFYIHGNPDFEFCENYYQVSDLDVLSAFTKVGRFLKDGRVFSNNSQQCQTDTSPKKIERKIPRNCRNLYLRNIVWSSFKWWNGHFDSFLEKYSPEVVLLQAGDCPFMYNIAMKIAKKFSIPLMIFNTENYDLKDVLYSSASSKDIFHFLLKKSLRKHFSRAMEMSVHCMYNTEYLQASYAEKYPNSKNSSVFYVTSDMKDVSVSALQSERFNLVYCGNLGVGRAQALCNIANVLLKVDHNAVLKIYGRFTNEEEKEMLCSQPNVEYNGVVSYDEIPEIISQSSIVVHCENKDRLKNLLCAFSTKIADCLACGKPFLVYAIKEYPFCEYLLKNRAAHIAQDEEELLQILQKCKDDLSYRNQYLRNAKEIAKKNHNLQVNAEKMFNIINQYDSIGKQYEF